MSNIPNFAASPGTMAQAADSVLGQPLLELFSARGSASPRPAVQGARPFTAPGYPVLIVVRSASLAFPIAAFAGDHRNSVHALLLSRRTA
jgi:hypothetical protein